MKYYILLLTIFFNVQSYGQLIQDESYLDSDFWVFKTELQRCILDKDTTKLKKLLADRVFESKDTCGYPGCTKEEFILYYFKEGAEDAWRDFSRIVRFGFNRLEDENPERIVPHEKLVFKGPSYLKDVDTDNELIILGENVNIREKPSLQSEVIRKATYEKFKCDCNITTMTKFTNQRVDGIDWIEIKLEDNKIGYVSSKLTSYSLIKEMTIAKVKGEWKIISFYNAPGC